MTVRMEWNGDEADVAVQAAAERGVDLGTHHLLGVSNERVPIQEHILEVSGTPSRDGMTGAVSYDTPYAVRQHEELTWRHDPGRRAKYLESALDDERDTIEALIAAQVRRALR